MALVVEALGGSKWTADNFREITYLEGLRFYVQHVRLRSMFSGTNGAGRLIIGCHDQSTRRIRPSTDRKVVRHMQQAADKSHRG